MKKVWLVGLTMVVVAGMAGIASAEHAIGAGANYWRTLGNIKHDRDFDRAGVSYYLSYQYRPTSMLFLEVELQQMPDGYMASSNTVYAPQAFVGLRLASVYAAVGAGKFYSDGDWEPQPFYMLRAGLDWALIPFVHLDINANYRFTDWAELRDRDINTDTIMLGAAVRMVF